MTLGAFDGSLDDLTSEEQMCLRVINMMRKKVPFWAGTM